MSGGVQHFCYASRVGVRDVRKPATHSLWGTVGTPLKHERALQ